MFRIFTGLQHPSVTFYPAVNQPLDAKVRAMFAGMFQHLDFGRNCSDLLR